MALHKMEFLMFKTAL